MPTSADRGASQVEVRPVERTTLVRALWVDATHGVAGDMLLGALVDLGVPLATLQAAVDSVIPGTVRLHAADVTRAGMRAQLVTVELLATDQPERGWPTIDQLMAESSLDSGAKVWARATFRRIGEAEARAHGIALDDVHFHEVGAWDSIADIVAFSAGVSHFGVRDIVASPAALGTGMVHMSHGHIAVPGPAVAELARGWPTLPGPDGAGELTTPTGMALLRLGQPGPLPPMTIVATGTGAGTRDLAGHANVTRLILGDRTPPARAPAAARSATGERGSLGVPPEHGPRLMIEATVDDLDPRLWPAILDQLVDAGADDAWLIPVVMRKGRPGHVLQVLAAEGHADALHALIYRTTTTLGIRCWSVHRDALHRDWRKVTVAGQVIRIKQGWLDGHVVTSQPEYTDVADAAAALALSEHDVLQRAIAAAGITEAP